MYLNILVIGNGFDIAHELETKYKDFLTACHKDEENRLDCKSNLWYRHFVSVLDNKPNTWIDLEAEILKVIENLNTLPALSNNSKILDLCPLKLSFPNKQPFSFNSIINNVNKMSENQVKEKLFADNYLIEDNSIGISIFIKTAEALVQMLYDQLREFTKSFEKYLKEDVMSQISEFHSKYKLSIYRNVDENSHKELHVLSFNYTDTCERYYQHQCNTTCRLNIKSFYVHGKICSNNNCNLVLGTKSFDNKKNTLLSNHIKSSFNVFKKHNQRHKFNTVEQYQELLNKLANDKIKPIFHVVGHSLDEADKAILKHLFTINDNAIINIYYFNEKSQEKLINNITEIIGEENTMRKVQLIYQHDPKKGILIKR